MLYIPNKIKILFSKKNNLILIKGPFGSQKIYFPFFHDFFLKEKKFCLKDVNSKKKKSFFNFLTSSFHNILFGVEKIIYLKGIGYESFFSKDFKNLIFKLGYSHLIRVKIPKNLWIRFLSKSSISIRGNDKLYVSNFAKKLKSLRKKNRYKEKGIFYLNEKIILKKGKVSD